MCVTLIEVYLRAANEAGIIYTDFSWNFNINFSYDEKSNLFAWPFDFSSDFLTIDFLTPELLEQFAWSQMVMFVILKMFFPYRLLSLFAIILYFCL